jgi:hypothetical protein
VRLAALTANLNQRRKNIVHHHPKCAKGENKNKMR